MISRSMQDALNEQVNKEQYSAQLYLAMSAHAEATGFHGTAAWLRLQAAEEASHALKLIHLLQERGGSVELKAIAAPEREFGGLKELFEKVLAHEQHITASIHKLFEAARAEKDYASELALQWFVTEQVEEEGNVQAILDQFRLIGDKGGALYHLDGKLGKRGND